MKKKYDFDLILSGETIKENRIKTLKEDKDKKDDIKIMIGMALSLIFIFILVITSENAIYNKIKAQCDFEGKELFQYHRYDGEKVWGCR